MRRDVFIQFPDIPSHFFYKPVGRSSFSSSTRNWFTLVPTCSTSLFWSRVHVFTASDLSDNWRSCVAAISFNVLPWQSNACCTSFKCCFTCSSHACAEIVNQQISRTHTCTVFHDGDKSQAAAFVGYMLHYII